MNTNKKDHVSFEHPIICYDGYCGLCDRFVRFLIQVDKRKIFRYTPLQSSVIQPTLASLKLNSENLPDSVILIAEGKIFVKSAAVFKIVHLLGYPFKIISIGKILPGALSDCVYDLIAANRYRIFGKSDTCQIPADIDKDLFLTCDDGR